MKEVTVNVEQANTLIDLLERTLHEFEIIEAMWAYPDSVFNATMRGQKALREAKHHLVDLGIWKLLRTES